MGVGFADGVGVGVGFADGVAVGVGFGEGVGSGVLLGSGFGVGVGSTGRSAMVTEAAENDTRAEAVAAWER